jgi:myo-inositol 2-dehydrogenase/D-chiro-inositol 1-dehydrogenase
LKRGVVTAAVDLNPQYGKKAADELGLAFFSSVMEMINSGGINALLVTSRDRDHEPFVMAALKAGIPVFCEKPLTPDAAGCQRIMDAEIIGGKRLIFVGFMRRYDSGYLQMRNLIGSGEYGAPLLAHCAHRNPAVDDSGSSEIVIFNTLCHEIDTMRWLLNEDYATIEVVCPKNSRHTHKKLQDPLVMVLTGKSGVRIDVECFMNCQVAYDITCEVVCEDGIFKLPSIPGVHITLKQSDQTGAEFTPVSFAYWERFEEAYKAEFQEWVDAIMEGRRAGPSTWDAYAAAVVTDAALASLKSGKTEKIPELPPCPAFYQND